MPLKLPVVHSIPAAILGVALTFACGMCVAGEARPPTLGWLEWAYLEPGTVLIKTKLDTGALTSSIDAEDITPFEKDGKTWVRFTIPLKSRPDDSDHGHDIVLERPVIRETVIKEFGDFSARRYVVDLTLCLAGITFTTPTSLANRSAMNYPLLLGRRALRGLGVIDSSRTFTFKSGCTARKQR